MEKALEMSNWKLPKYIVYEFDTEETTIFPFEIECDRNITEPVIVTLQYETNDENLIVNVPNTIQKSVIMCKECIMELPDNIRKKHNKPITVFVTINHKKKELGAVQLLAASTMKARGLNLKKQKVETTKDEKDAKDDTFGDDFDKCKKCGVNPVVSVEICIPCSVEEVIEHHKRRKEELLRAGEQQNKHLLARVKEMSREVLKRKQEEIESAHKSLVDNVISREEIANISSNGRSNANGRSNVNMERSLEEQARTLLGLNKDED
jgi:hypothetical protein